MFALVGVFDVCCCFADSFGCGLVIVCCCVSCVLVCVLYLFVSVLFVLCCSFVGVFSLCM